MAIQNVVDPAKTLALVRRLGKLVTFHAPASKGTMDPGTGAVTAASTTDYEKRVTPPFPAKDRWVDGKLVQRDDTEMYLPASGLEFEPVNGMKMTIDGDDKWQIQRIMPIYAGDSITLYRILAKK